MVSPRCLWLLEIKPRMGIVTKYTLCIIHLWDIYKFCKQEFDLGTLQTRAASEVVMPSFIKAIALAISSLHHNVIGYFLRDWTWYRGNVNVYIIYHIHVIPLLYRKILLIIQYKLPFKKLGIVVLWHNCMYLDHWLKTKYEGINCTPLI